MTASSDGPPVAPPAVEQKHAINFEWLITLRWVVIIGQIAIIAAVDRLMGIALPLLPMAGIVALEALSNVGGVLWRRRATEIGEAALGLLMLIDVALLTALLYVSGGPFNPFSVLYLVNIALAAVVMSPLWTWTLVVLSLACFGTLFLGHLPLAGEHHGAHEPRISMHLQGMWIAFGVAAAFIVYFIERVTRALAARDAELAAARSLSARHERLASLAALAAGAAHELATPLSTIAVVARELERQLVHGGVGDAAMGDARLIRQQVERCREILTQLSADAGESAGEAVLAVAIEDLLALATGDLAQSGRIRRVITPAAQGRALAIPPRAMAQALRGILKNALEASGAAGEVVVRVEVGERGWRIAVVDRGVGMAPEVLARAGEPFFTTKSAEGAGHGMGLGLFLARVLLERLGGSVEIESTPGGGTTVTLLLPPGGAATICRIAAGPEADRP